MAGYQAKVFSRNLGQVVIVSTALSDQKCHSNSSEWQLLVQQHTMYSLGLVALVLKVYD